MSGEFPRAPGGRRGTLLPEGVVPAEWADTVDQLVAWGRAGAGSPLLLLAGLTAAGRGELLALAERAWRGQGTWVLVGRAPMAPGDVVVAALYDAVIGSSRWPAAVAGDQAGQDRAGQDRAGQDRAGQDRTTEGAVPAAELPQRAAAGWADLIRGCAGPHPFVLALHEVDIWSDDTRVFLQTLATNLQAGTPRGRVVVNPVAGVPQSWTDVVTLTCPRSPAPDRLVEQEGARRRVHPALASVLEVVSGDRRVMLDVLREWLRQGLIRLVDGVWLPGEDLTAPSLPLSRPALDVLRPLTERQYLVVAALSVLGPVGGGVLEAVFDDAAGDGGAADDQKGVSEVVGELLARGLVRDGRQGFIVADCLVRASAAAAVGAAQQALWRERADRVMLSSGQGDLTPGSVMRACGGAEAMTGRPALVEIPGDGEQVIEAARWAAARTAPDAGWWAGLAAVVLARRGRLDRARIWLESACSEQEGATRAVARWGEAEILRLEGRPAQAAAALDAAVEASVQVAEGSTALWMLLESERLSLAEVQTASGPRRYVPTAPEHTFFEDRDYLSAIHLMRATIRAVEAGQVPAQRLTEVLGAARSRRCVLEWCRAARLARAHGLAWGRVPTGPDGADDIQRALLSLLAAGLSTSECAVALSMQVRAVEYRIRALFEASGTTSRAQLVRAYVDGRVLDPSR